MLRGMLRDAERTSNSNGHSSADDPIFQVLHKLRDRYHGKSITTRQLLEVFAEDLPPSLRYEGRKSLDWFYEGWVKGTAVPRFELQSAKYVDRGGATLVSGMILQKAAPKDLVTSVPVYAFVGRRQVFLGRVFAEGPETPFRLNAPPGARRVVLDSDQTLLARSK
jgi:hypothetical protein